MIEVRDTADGKGPTIGKVTISWTADEDGADTQFIKPLNGQLRNVIVKPGSELAAGFKIEVLDEAGIDILNGQGQALSESQPSIFSPGVTASDGVNTNTGVTPRCIADALTVNVTDAGDRGKGEIILYIY